MKLDLQIYPHLVEDMAKKYAASSDEFDQIDSIQLEMMKKLINDQYYDISQIVNVVFLDEEPYGENPTLAKMLEDFRESFIIMHTTGNDSKVWGKFTNLQFRVVHDFIHLVNEVEFNHTSEVTAFHKQMEFSLQDKYAKKYPFLNWEVYSNILRSEIVYQSAYKEQYGKFHIDQKVILKRL